MPIITASVIGAGAGLGGSIFSGIMGASGASKSAGAIRYSADVARQTALELDAKARADVQPFRDAGVTATRTLSSLLTNDRSLDDVLKESSLFKFQSELGTRGINRELSARGLHGSGAGLETLSRFNAQLVGEEGDRIFNRLFGVAGLGANAASHQATNTSATGQAIARNELTAGLGIGQAQTQRGAALGSIGTGVADAIQGGIGNYVGYQLNAPLLESLANRSRGAGQPAGLPYRDTSADFSTFNFS